MQPVRVLPELALRSYEASYHLIQIANQGSAATVYTAQAVTGTGDTPVAIKVIRKGPGAYLSRAGRDQQR